MRNRRYTKDSINKLLEANTGFEKFVDINSSEVKETVHYMVVNGKLYRDNDICDDEQVLKFLITYGEEMS